MSASLKAIDGTADLPALMNDLAARARAAARVLSLAPSEQKNRALESMERAIRANGDDRIFPYNHKSVSAAFTRGCQDQKIDDLHFHDMRHEGTSRLSEAGFRIEQVALVTGHKDWKMLRRYTHIRPESLHDHLNRVA